MSDSAQIILANNNGEKVAAARLDLIKATVGNFAVLQEFDRCAPRAQQLDMLVGLLVRKDQARRKAEKIAGTRQQLEAWLRPEGADFVLAVFDFEVRYNSYNQGKLAWFLRDIKSRASEIIEIEQAEQNRFEAEEAKKERHAQKVANRVIRREAQRKAAAELAKAAEEAARLRLEVTKKPLSFIAEYLGLSETPQVVIDAACRAFGVKIEGVEPEEFEAIAEAIAEEFEGTTEAEVATFVVVDWQQSFEESLSVLLKHLDGATVHCLDLARSQFLVETSGVEMSEMSEIADSIASEFSELKGISGPCNMVEFSTISATIKHELARADRLLADILKDEVPDTFSMIDCKRVFGLAKQFFNGIGRGAEDACRVAIAQIRSEKIRSTQVRAASRRRVTYYHR